ncbi:MAG TPA: hypothetical protein VH599_18890 [Ktedonobacterales bacterium]
MTSVVLTRLYQGGLKEHLTTFADPRSGLLVRPDDTTHHTRPGVSLAEVLEQCHTPRLMLVAALADVPRSWFEAAHAQGWVLSHFSMEQRTATARRGDRTIEIRLASASFFKDGADLAIVTRAWKALRQIVGRHGGGLPLLGSPGSIGLALLERLLPAGSSYPVQSEAIRALLHTHSPQPRKECLTASTLEHIPGFHYLDGRWMYAACLIYSFPVGSPERDCLDQFERYRPGWYRITATIPADWQQVGLLPVPGERMGSEKPWTWPATPGAVLADLWVSEPELRLALEQGWACTIHERLLFAGQKVLRTWQERLVRMRADAERLAPNLRPLVSGAIREILLHAVGRWHMQSWEEERTLTLDEWTRLASSLSADEQMSAYQRETGVMSYVAKRPLSGRETKWLRPEWSAYVWAYCRVLLTRRLLSLPRATILGVNTDAIYVTVDPGWPDDGTPGSFRSKGVLAGPLAAPRTEEDLRRLKEVAERTTTHGTLSGW